MDVVNAGELREEWGIDLAGDRRHIVLVGSMQAALDRLGAIAYDHESSHVNCRAELVSRTVSVTAWTLRNIVTHPGEVH
jgi:hypothetical protein